ncbi:EVE domain-containing protein [Solimonas sp. K1W22B-7]|uniref:EVE domain-containing protein n=1 Tax=Solimonas sp. K1W22B-7 TaxID=2303331 RepID=UPI000E32FF5B|nr:EVE domain-containing protein [Solimonas sp. K1W22B-7]AXQ28818.1 EVE domain-containing protein [Solimonas sp. K1W22B-7]
MAYWLMKSEPDCFSIDDLAKKPKKTAPWDGVRNYQVRNMFRDDMKPGDKAFFYHSSCEVPGIYGVMKIASVAYPDPTQFDPKADHYDAKSKKEEPRWLLVDVTFERKLKTPVTLAQMRDDGKLASFRLLAPGNRLSVIPVGKEHWDYILSLE